MDYRVKVRRRVVRGFADGIDMMFSGRRWSWWCTCDGKPWHALDQQHALAQGLAHLDHVHRQRRR